MNVWKWPTLRVKYVSYNGLVSRARPVDKSTVTLYGALPVRPRGLVPVLILIISGHSLPQGLVSSAPQFDVAVIKPSKAPRGNASTSFTDHQFTSQNRSLRYYIERAFNVDDYAIAGPRWLADEDFDITARVDGSTSASQISEMLKNLLIDRFHLVISTKEQRIKGYRLIRGRTDGTRMPRSEDGTSGYSVGRGMLRAHGISMTRLASLLAQELSRPVTDMTGITGNFDIALRWEADGSGVGATADEISNSAALVSAIREQLGLLLDPTKVPVQVVVIESASRRPEEN